VGVSSGVKGTSVSVLDQFRLAEEALTRRLRELRPLADEFRKLEQIAKRRGLQVGDDDSDGASDKGEPASSQRRRSRPAARATRSSQAAAETTRPARTTRQRRARPAAAESKPEPGTRQRANRREDIVRLVQQRPGITIKQIGDELGIDPTGLYRPVRELQQQGAITKQGTQLNPAS
jgi:Winged helix-turn-helix DNA-binding